jgi:hypothetical protein
MASKDPNLRILIATNTVPNARKKLQDIRGLFDSNPTYRALFPDLLPKRYNKWTDESAEINRSKDFPEATFEISGMKTKKTGTHYNIIIEDDTVAPDESEMGLDITVPSKENVDSGIGWHKNATSLLVPSPKGSNVPQIRIIVSTRWGDYDLINHVVGVEGYNVFDMPAMNTKGEPLFENFYSKEKLEEIKAQVGPYMFSCLYLNTPLDASLRTFKDEWIQYKGDEEIPYEKMYYTISVDPAVSEKDGSCETAITRVGHFLAENSRSYQYWLDAIHGHFNPYETVQKILDLAQQDLERTRTLVVETIAYQAALKYALWDEMVKRNIHIGIAELQTRTAKDVRIQGLVPYFAAGRIFLRRGISPQVESQLKQYPHGRLVDVIDSFAMHRKVSPGEKAQVILSPKKVEDPNSYEAVMKELKRNYATRMGLLGLPVGVDVNNDRMSNFLDDGLGNRSFFSSIGVN